MPSFWTRWQFKARSALTPGPLPGGERGQSASALHDLFAQLVDLVTQAGGFLELQVLGVLVHLPLELADGGGGLGGGEVGVLPCPFGHGLAAHALGGLASSAV